MCDDYYDEMAKVWDETERTARVQHTCYACEETIGKGDTYRRTSILGDGHWSTYKHCIRCARIIDALKPVLQDGFGECTLGLDCGKVWENAPEYVSELAFALPSDTLPPTSLMIPVAPDDRHHSVVMEQC